MSLTVLIVWCVVDDIFSREQSCVRCWVIGACQRESQMVRVKRHKTSVLSIKQSKSINEQQVEIIIAVTEGTHHLYYITHMQHWMHIFMK